MPSERRIYWVSYILYHLQQLHDEGETLLTVKTIQDLFLVKLLPLVQEIHPNDVPETITLATVLDFEIYLNWIDDY